MKNPVGRPPDPRRRWYMKEYGISSMRDGHGRKKLSQAAMDQLDRCSDDSARRLLLGKGRAA